MAPRHFLTINLNEQCAIDAGSWQECVAEDQTLYRLISPPQTTMYRQVLSYVEETTRDEKVPPKSQLHFGEVAIATVVIEGSQRTTNKANNSTQKRGLGTGECEQLVPRRRHSGVRQTPSRRRMLRFR